MGAQHLRREARRSTTRDRRRRAWRADVVSVALLAMTAMASCRPPRSIADVRYRCADGAVLRARYYRDRVRVTLPSGEVALAESAAASGTRYANDTLVFWSKGPAAFVEQRGRVRYADCYALAHP